MVDIYNGFYIVEYDDEITILERSGGEWHAFDFGEYGKYDIKPTRVISRIKLPKLKESSDD